MPEAIDTKASGSSGETLHLGDMGRADERELAQIAVEAYVFLYPLVNMDVFRLQATNIEPGQRRTGRLRGRQPGAGRLPGDPAVPVGPRSRAGGGHHRPYG